MAAANPEIMKWAREKSGLSLEEAAHALGIHSAWGTTGGDRLAALETGDGEPSQQLLQKMSQRYHRSLLVFYLDAPPKQGDRGQDFRLAPGAQPPAYNATLDALLRDIKARQGVVRTLLDDEDTARNPFVGSASTAMDPTGLGDSIATSLLFHLGDFRNQTSISAAFSYLRSRIEGVGIFVILAGNLGSHHSNISSDIYRGFAISDPIAPFIVLNDQDARSAWPFTALHETVHIWLGTTGVSGAAADTQIERFCNDVAGEILLPTEELQEIATISARSLEESAKTIAEFAIVRNISRAMVTYKLFRSGIIVAGRWRELTARFQQEWLQSKSQNNNKDGGSQGGPSYYTIRRHRLGPSLLGLVNRSLQDGLISPTRAGQVLGVKARSVGPLLNDIGAQAGA